MQNSHDYMTMPKLGYNLTIPICTAKVTNRLPLTLSQQALVFMCLLKTLWEKKKLLVTSNFFFSHNVFYLFGEPSAIFIKFEIVVCKLFQFGRV